MKIVHWSNKVDDIQCLVDKLNTELCLISEANLFIGLDSHLAIIHGYEIVTTKSMSTLGVSRLVLLVREGVKVDIQESWMDEIVASIWLKIRRRGSKSITIGGVYREHSLMLLDFTTILMNRQHCWAGGKDLCTSGALLVLTLVMFWETPTSTCSSGEFLISHMRKWSS